MNDELKKLQHDLELATAADCPPDVPLDPQTASLREGWLLLDQLLQAAYPPPQRPLKIRPVAHGSTPAGGGVAVVAVLAAALLVGVTLAWSLTGSGRAHRLASPHPGRTDPGQTEHELAVADPTWDDPLDRQLAEVGRQIVYLQQDRYYLDDGLAEMAYGLEEIEQAMEQEIRDGAL